MWRTTLSATAILVILSIGSDISLAPATGILEQVVCNKYYGRSRVPFHSSTDTVSIRDCKIVPVQSEMAYINAWKDAFELLPGKWSTPK